MTSDASAAYDGIVDVDTSTLVEIKQDIVAGNTLPELASALGVPKSDDELLVDLGLPSGNLWATRNVDVTRQNGFAASPYQYECSFFSWGNTDGHNPISSSAFSYNWGSSNSGTYASTHGSTLTADAGLSDDFGRFNLGGEWRLPTTGDFAELLNSTYTKYVDANGNEVTGTNKLVTVNGVVGIRLMSKANGKTIFFPCSGDGLGTLWDNRGTRGFYWSSSIYSTEKEKGRNMYFNSDGVYPDKYNLRLHGFPCRPVASKSYKDVYPTLSGLASALGGSTSTMYNATDAQFDALYGTSSVHTFNGYRGTYFGDNTYGFVKTTMGLDGYCIQEVYNILTQSYWMRSKTSSAASWRSFTRADNFGCNTPADLASLLGGEMVDKNVGYYSTEETIELGGYGLYILTDCANTGGTTLFTFSYQANSVNIISDPSGNVSSGHYSITKSSTGVVCVVTNNNTTKATTIIKIGGSL